MTFPFSSVAVNGSGTSFPLTFPFSSVSFGGSGSGYSTTIDSTTGDFSGWAWNGNDNNIGVGWISFNSKDCDTDGDGTIDNSNCGSGSIGSYKVTAILNQAPTIITTDAPLADYCSQPINTASLNWSYYDPDGDSQSAYQIVFNNADNTTSPLLNTGRCTSQGGNCLVAADATTFPISNIPTINLSLNTTYYWWITVWDSKGAPSTQYAGKIFTTPAHQYPVPYFIWTPNNPSAGEEVNFQGADSSNLSQYFDNFGAHYCDDSSNCVYKWTFNDANNPLVSYTGGSDTSSSTTIIFPAKATVHAALTVTDNSNGYHCSTSTSPNDIGLKNKLPKWIETK